MRNWPIRFVVTMALILPMTAVVAAALVIASMRLDEASAARQTYAVASWLGHVNDLVHALQSERHAVSDLVLSGYTGAGLQQRVAEAARIVDAAQQQVIDSLDTLPDDERNRVGRAVAAARAQSDLLVVVRDEVTKGTLDPAIAADPYTSMVESWLGVGLSLTGIGSRDPDLVRLAVALSAVSSVNEQADQQYLYVETLIDLESVAEDSAARARTAVGAERAALAEFRRAAPPEQVTFYDETVAPVASQAEGIRDLVLSGGAGGVLGSDWAARSAAKQGALQAVESKIVTDLESASQASLRRAEIQALVTALAVAIVILIWLAVSVLISTRLVRALHRLRDGALRAARQRLPEVTETLRAGHVVDPASEPPAFADHPRNEIGDVAQAVNTLYASAVTATYEMASVRGVDEVLRTLARRSLHLTRRQLQLITELERKERDPKTVKTLFGIDHQATRMRRLAESLLVLAGDQPHRASREPTTLFDVLRASAAETEDYTRVRVHAEGTSLRIAGAAVGDLTHLLAELLDNALSFSPAAASVDVRAGLAGHGWAIDIEDRGVGLDDNTIARFNARLADPPPFQPRGSVQIGLTVVAQLAARHGIRVRMRPSVYLGLHVAVILPATILEDAQPAGADHAQSTPPRMGRHARQQEPATDLAPDGHDASRDGTSGQPELAPLMTGTSGRSLALPALARRIRGAQLADQLRAGPAAMPRQFSLSAGIPAPGTTAMDKPAPGTTAMDQPAPGTTAMDQPAPGNPVAGTRNANGPAPGAPGPEAHVAEAPDPQAKGAPEDARRLVEGFMHGYARGQIAAGSGDSGSGADAGAPENRRY